MRENAPSRIARRLDAMRPWLGMDNKRTIKRVDIPTAMLIGLSDAQGDQCVTALKTTAIRVIRVAHPAAAGERIPVTMPSVVVVSEALQATERDMIFDRSVAVGAEVVKLPPAIDDEALTTLLKGAARKHRPA
jgi:hypothetical protein